MMKKQIFLLIFNIICTPLLAEPDKQSSKNIAHRILLTASSSQSSSLTGLTECQKQNKCHKIIHTELAAIATCATTGFGIWSLGAHRGLPHLKTIGAFVITTGIIGSHLIGTAAYLALSKK